MKNRSRARVKTLIIHSPAVIITKTSTYHHSIRKTYIQDDVKDGVMREAK